jgi:NSS family neurotransmitter:Na+ symporter
MAEFKLFGMNMFDLFDYLSSNILLPLGGIAIALFVGWVWGYPALQQAISNQQQLPNKKLSQLLFLILRFITPLLILAVMLHALNIL